MKATQIRALANIAQKPGASAAAQLVATIRVCRLFCIEMTLIEQERRALERRAAKLKAFLPFTAATVADLEQQAREHGADSLDILRMGLANIGRVTILQSDTITAALGFERLCDLLGVNRAHRAKAMQDGHTSVHALAFIAGLEDSATRQMTPRQQGGPLYTACLYAMAEFTRTAPAGVLPDLSEPGETARPKLSPELRIVGR